MRNCPGSRSNSVSASRRSLVHPATNPDQLELFNEAEAEADPSKEEPTVETVTYQRKKQPGQRETMLESLPVETIEYALQKKSRHVPVAAVRYMK